MRKYIDKDKVLEYIIFGVVGKDITCGELKRAIEHLPTIEVSEDCISREFLEQRIGFEMLEDTEPDIHFGWNKALEFMSKVVKNAPSVVPTTENKYHRHGIRLEDGTPIYECIGCDEVSCDMRGAE